MQCRNCNETLIMADRQGIEIDYCPKCRGVWLDRGELDKIVERSAGYSPNPTTSHDDDHYREKQYREQYNHPNDPYYKHKKKKGFLSDFFDFD